MFLRTLLVIISSIASRGGQKVMLDGDWVGEAYALQHSLLICMYPDKYVNTSTNTVYLVTIYPHLLFI